MSESYALARSVHVGSVALSLLLFVVRGVWMIQGSELLRARPVKVMPHVVDTILLLSAILLAVLSHQYPLQASWLTAKVAALVIYIVLGTIALRRGSTRSVRIAAWCAALLVFAYIVAVAVTRDPLPIRALV